MKLVLRRIRHGVPLDNVLEGRYRENPEQGGKPLREGSANEINERNLQSVIRRSTSAAQLSKILRFTSSGLNTRGSVKTKTKKTTG